MKRKRYSDDFKMQVVKEAIETGNKTAVARRYELAPNMVQRWVKEMEDGKYGNVDLSAVSPLETKALAQENDKLKQLFGRKRS
jgi:transposase-like protein